MSYYDAPSGKVAEVKPLDMETFVKLARQTDILAGDGAAGSGRASGPCWPDRRQARSRRWRSTTRRGCGLCRAHPPARSGSGGWRYDVVLTGYASAAEAEVAAARLKAATELKPTRDALTGLFPLVSPAG
jgi:hypothetical protein